MQTEIIISHGHVRLVHPVYLKPHAANRLTIDIPDDAVAPSRDWFPSTKEGEAGADNLSARPGSLQELYDQILGKMAKPRPATSIGDDFQTLQDALEERYNG